MYTKLPSPRRRCGVRAFLLLTAIFTVTAQAALTRLEVSYYTDYAVNVSFDHRTETVYASALTASFVPGARNGPASAPLPAGYSPFTAFSLDIGDDLKSKSYWQAGALPSIDPDPSRGHQEPQWAPGGIYRAASLYEAYSGQVNSSTPDGKLAGAALQLAIWDVLYGDGRAVNHAGSGFFVGGKGEHEESELEKESQLVFAANAMLASAANSIDLAARETFWEAVLGPNGRQPMDGNQDLLGPVFFSSVVPEPSTFLAAGGTLAYLLVSRAWRRSWKVK